MMTIGLALVLGNLIIEVDLHIAPGVFALARLADLLDGFIKERKKQGQSKISFGTCSNHLLIKILIGILYVHLSYADLTPVPLTGMIISRDAVLTAAVFYVRYQTLPTPQTLSKRSSPRSATARLKLTFITPVFDCADSIYLQIQWIFIVFTTVASAYSYYHYGQKTVQVIKGRRNSALVVSEEAVYIIGGWWTSPRVSLAWCSA
uniref:cardiolipin synthase (CMP-forming) n=1 Tax=Equus caballus TaxID=9796 RepID=A0A9L0SBE0_HORSE